MSSIKNSNKRARDTENNENNRNFNNNLKRRCLRRFRDQKRCQRNSKSQQYTSEQLRNEVFEVLKIEYATMRNNTPVPLENVERKAEESKMKHISDELLESNSTEEFENAVSDKELLALMDEIMQEEIKLEQLKIEKEMADDFEIHEQEYLLYAVNACDEVVSGYDISEAVLCPQCRLYDVNKTGAVFFCKCGLRIDSKESYLLHQHRDTDRCISNNRIERGIMDSTRDGCHATPVFRVRTMFGMSALYLECDVCDLIHIVI